LRPEDTNCDAVPVTFEEADLKQVIGQIATNKAQGEDDIRIQLFRGMEDEFYGARFPFNGHGQ
jgi:hypothetical protein